MDQPGHRQPTETATSMVSVLSYTSPMHPSHFRVLVPHSRTTVRTCGSDMHDSYLHQTPKSLLPLLQDRVWDFADINTLERMNVRPTATSSAPLYQPSHGGKLGDHLSQPSQQNHQLSCQVFHLGQGISDLHHTSKTLHTSNQILSFRDSRAERGLHGR